MTALFFSLPLIGIIYEDFKFRAIHWYWLMLILGIGFLHFGFHLQQGIINISFLLIQFVLISIYFSVKEKKLINIINKQLGIGDVLFLLPLALFFSPINFLFFLVISLLGTLGLTLLAKAFNYHKFITIPLAGFQSIFLIIFTWAGWWNSFDFRWDSLL